MISEVPSDRHSIARVHSMGDCAFTRTPRTPTHVQPEVPVGPTAPHPQDKPGGSSCAQVQPPQLGQDRVFSSYSHSSPSQGSGEVSPALPPSLMTA